MAFGFPARDTARKFAAQLSADDTANEKGITVPAKQYGILYRLWIDVDVASEGDLEALPASALIQVTIGATAVWATRIHPLVEHQVAAEAKLRWVDLGPWVFDFGEEGIYSGIKGDNIVVNVPAMGTGIKSQIVFQYSGD